VSANAVTVMILDADGSPLSQWAVADPVALRAAMRRVVREPLLARRLGAQARADVARRWCREPVARTVRLRLQVSE
jgi:hypothetical protein